MHFDSRIPVFWAANLLLFLLAILVNSRLAPFSLYLILLGPMLVLPALYLKSSPLVLSGFITGLSIDALLPQPYWLFIYGFPFIGLLIRSMRGHFRVETSYRFILLTHIANFACIGLLCITQSIYFGQFSTSLIQITTTVLLSHVLLHVVAPWFFSFEHFLLHLLKIKHIHDDEFSAR